MTACTFPLIASKSLNIRDIAPAVADQTAVFPGDTVHSHESPSHHQLLPRGLRVLEYLRLDDVPVGDCE